MRNLIGTITGKTVSLLLKMHKGEAQAMPGLVVDKVVRNYLPSMLKRLPHGAVLITGTNGKTTTTKIVVSLLESQGLRVLTNATGSNMTRGLISVTAQKATWTGTLPFDIAVFEVDEAYAARIAQQIKPRYILALNATRDQLDRFGEVDTVARLIGDSLAFANEGVVTNADDIRLRVLAPEHAKAPVTFFGVAAGLAKYFPQDHELVAVGKTAQSTKSPQAEVVLSNFTEQKATYLVDGKPHDVQLQLVGQHNFQNAAAGLALVKHLLPDVPARALVAELGNVTPPFGRGQIFTAAPGKTTQLILVKNPAGFRQALSSTTAGDVMIAINDNIADGRDVSWLWDVDFTDLAPHGVLLTTGSRAADMALRLQNDDVAVKHVERDIPAALTTFTARPGYKTLFASYTAMLQIHELLSKKAS